MSQSHFKIFTTTAVFIAIISFPMLNSKIKWVKDIASFENRQMVSKPVFDLARLDPYPVKYEKYYNDNFPFRSILVKYFNLINLRLFKKSPIPTQAIIGSDGWLFLTGNELDSYNGVHPFKPEELLAFKLELEYRKKYLNAMGCKFYFMVAPVKANIYSDKIPFNSLRIRTKSWGEQLTDYLNKSSEIKPINIYDIFRTNKDKELLYHKLDNHWNHLGAFYAVNEILKYIHQDFPKVSPLSIAAFNLVKTQTHGGNIASMFGDTSLFKENAIHLEPKSGFLARDVPNVGYPVTEGFVYPSEFEMGREIKGSDKPRILIISDSFGGNLFPFQSEQFSRSVKIFDSWEYKLNENIVKNEKPDMVLLVILESNLRNVLKYQSRFGNYERK